jgi:hypothetical protein
LFIKYTYQRKKKDAESQSKHYFMLEVKQLHVSAIYSYLQAEYRTIKEEKSKIQRNKIVGTRSHLTSMYFCVILNRVWRSADCLGIE